MVLSARLYPDNDIAAQGGVISGSVANVMNGKGRFQLQYGAEMPSGESTRVSNDSRKGIASAYGSSGSYMRCEYQMSSPRHLHLLERRALYAADRGLAALVRRLSSLARRSRAARKR